MVRTTVSKKIKLILGITSPDARWGIFPILISFWISLWAFALSFYQFADSGRGTWMIILAWLVAILGSAFFLLAVSIGIYWYKHPHKDVTPDILNKLTNIESSIDNLTNEIRQDRDRGK
jgi:hypothetical protein